MRLLTALLLLSGCTRQVPAPFLEHVDLLTGGARPGERVPAVVALHGLGDRPENFGFVFERLPVRARVVIPRAPTPGHGGYYWFATRTRSGDEQKIGRELAAAADEVDRLIVELNLDRPIVTGFSQGGMLAFAVAVRHPTHVRAAIPVAGWLPPSLLPSKRPKRAPPIHALHGRADPIVPFRLDAEGVAALQARGWDAQLIGFDDVPHTVTSSIHQRWMHLIDRFSAI